MTTARVPLAGVTIEKNALAIVLFLVSESVSFALLILAYVYFRASQAAGATAATTLDPTRMGVFSLFLFSSSATMWRAGVHADRGAIGRARPWLAGTMALGALFLYGQGTEYAGLFRRGVTISTDLFGTTFFSLTGFHGLHVTVGLLLLGIAFVLGAGRGRGWKWPVALRSIGYYWHFVDAVWVVIFSVVYLWTFL
jgi:heme/copper-type cytochrome/quinol oxidase subunit 3